MARTKQTARRHSQKPSGKDDAGSTMANGIDLEYKAIAEGEMRAELKHIDKRFTEEGNAYYAETQHEDIPEQIDWWSNFALCVVRHYNMYNKEMVEKVCLEINSSHLKRTLRDLVPDFPGVSFHTRNITLDAPYRVLYHYRKEIESAADALEEGSQAAEHHQLLVDFIHEQFQETIDATENLLEQGLITCEHLWTIFTPGCTVYGRVFGQPRAFIIESYSQSCRPKGWFLQVKYVDFDGTDFGHRQETRFVHDFDGTKSIDELSAFPLKWHKDRVAVEKYLIQRGRVFEKQSGIQFHRYNGIALDTLHDEDERNKVVRYSVSGRVVVDVQTFHRMNANFAYYVSAFDNKDESHRINLYDSGTTMELLPTFAASFEPLTDEQCLLAASTVRGFSFNEKRWLDFFVDKLSSPDWNTHAFDQLVLPPAQKNLVRSLVSTHAKKRDGLDDIVKGKGMGLVMVLHGPPGVGKTLTAETVAEYTKKPLYMVSSGDLGTNASMLDQRLTQILDMASTWNAVLLIDEADIFLEARSLHDLERNSLVSIFLRVLEYYEGILFLTSNRVATFDSAFKSRIHVPLKYGDLTFDSRKAIWNNFLAQKSTDVQVHVTETDVELLAKAELNGRQIKNVVRTAKSLAQFQGETLDCPKLMQVVQIQLDFEDELDGTLEVDNRSLGGRMAVVNGN